MKNRPTIALAMIVKNEEHNMSGLLKSINGCFDEIHITDTGSTDKTVEVLTKPEASELAGAPIKVHQFEWVNNFSKARQYSFDQVSKDIDFIMWMDADDVLSDRGEFIKFRDNIMHCADNWLVTYNYAFDDNGNPVCQFLRERIVRNNDNFYWEYYVHEGLIAKNPKFHSQSVGTFSINHIRTEMDIKQDRSRNLKLFEANGIDSDRMHYYYGKELFDAGEYLKSGKELSDVLTKENSDLQMHDRIMGMQYLAMSYSQCGKWSEAMNICLQGLQLDPGRAEFWTLSGDANMQMGRLDEAALFYQTAKQCGSSSANMFIYTSPHARLAQPCMNLAEIYMRKGRFDLAKKEAETIKEFFPEQAGQMIARATEAERLNKLPQDLVESNDIIITCPPGGITSDWDENTLAQKGEGGSETACIELARELAKKTNRSIKVFQNRKTMDIMPSGVEYRPNSLLQEYLFKYKPHAHIAWRHATRLTEAPSYVWSHDLVTAGGEELKYDKYICLTPFHKEFVHSMQKVPYDKILTLRNGVDVSLFKNVEGVEKKFGKIIFSSSPDRGLDRAIEIVKRARKTYPDLELHVFYGTGNMRKMGMTEEADRLDDLMRDNDFVKYHGFVQKQELIRHYKESCVWVYCADFIETSCITAMEAMLTQCYPLVRNMGALKYTLSEAIEKDMCTILDRDGKSDEDLDFWADELKGIIEEKKWERINIDPEKYSWSSVADEFIEALMLN